MMRADKRVYEILGTNSAFQDYQVLIMAFTSI